MLQLENKSPFQALLGLFPDPEGVDTLYVTVKATFSLSERPQIAPEQVPIRMVDEFHGEPGRSSLKYAGEVHLSKPGTDVLVSGNAWAPGGTAVQTLDCSVRVGSLQKTVRVFGDRTWRVGLLSARPSSPEPFVSMPLRWERSFGGEHAIDSERKRVLWERRNPVGVGFAGKRRGRDLKKLAVPNLEDPAQPLVKAGRKPPPACFAPLAPSWAPRLDYAGTYDQAWQETRAPFLPQDFDPRFFQTAPAGLVSPTPLAGGEPVELRNLSRRGDLRFTLPSGKPRVSVRIAGRNEGPECNLETVLFEPDEERFTLLWRAALGCDKQALRVERVTIEPGAVA